MDTINVDAQGVGILDGEDHHLRAARKAVRAGLLVNEDVLLRYPDGTVGKGTRVLVTPKGLEHLKREMPIGSRGREGTA